MRVMFAARAQALAAANTFSSSHRNRVADGSDVAAVVRVLRDSKGYSRMSAA